MQKVIFNDEYKTKFYSNAREYVKRFLGERKNARFTTKMVTVGGGHIMV